MNSKKTIIATFSLLLCALLVMGTINVVIDPLFQYHKPWFGLEPVVTNERYQNAGIAKNFNFENVILGNSMCENFLVSDVEEVFGGKTVKLTASGSRMLDWSYLLKILSERKNPPKKILVNLDFGFIDSSYKKTRHELPFFLYDDNPFNDVEYLFNFTLLRNYTYEAINANINDSVPDYNTVFGWFDETKNGKDKVIDSYFRNTQNNPYRFSEEIYTDGNLRLLKKSVESMPDTQFVFFISPYSVLNWKDIVENGYWDEYKKEFEKIITFMLQYKNISVYAWADDEIFDIISDLDNYRDEMHYGAHINKEILIRIDRGIGLLPANKEKWQPVLDKYFDYFENFDYESIFI